jgi:hypothetical protein
LAQITLLILSSRNARSPHLCLSAQGHLVAVMKTEENYKRPKHMAAASNYLKKIIELFDNVNIISPPEEIQ